MRAKLQTAAGTRALTYHGSTTSADEPRKSFLSQKFADVGLYGDVSVHSRLELLVFEKFTKLWGKQNGKVNRKLFRKTITLKTAARVLIWARIIPAAGVDSRGET